VPQRQDQRQRRIDSLATIDYISVADAETLDELDTVNPPALMSLAVRIGKTRLIAKVVVE
jgi:pantoate--beta-alanine ligase